MNPYLALIAPGVIMLLRCIAIILNAVFKVPVLVAVMPLFKAMAVVFLGLALIPSIRLMVQEILSYQAAIGLFQLATKKEHLAVPDTSVLLNTVERIIIFLTCILAVVLL